MEYVIYFISKKLEENYFYCPVVFEGLNGLFLQNIEQKRKEEKREEEKKQNIEKMRQRKEGKIQNIETKTKRKKRKERREEQIKKNKKKKKTQFFFIRLRSFLYFVFDFSNS